MHECRVHNDPNQDEMNKHLPADGERRIMMVSTLKAAATKKQNNQTRGWGGGGTQRCVIELCDYVFNDCTVIQILNTTRWSQKIT